MFVNHRLAKVAAEKELQEAQARIDVQQQLAAAQAQVHVAACLWPCSTMQIDIYAFQSLLACT